MAYGLALLALGTGLSAYGKYRAMADEAAAERENGAFYREQAQYALKVMERDKRISSLQYARLKGDQIVSAASSGIDISGSVYDTLYETELLGAQEQLDIETQAFEEYKLAMLRSQSSYRQAGRIRKSAPYSVGGTLLTGMGNAYAVGSR